MKKIVISWLVCVLGLVGLMVWVGKDIVWVKAPDSTSDVGLIQAKFSLQSGTGKTVTAADFKGRYMLVYFGFTHCPDTCPTTLLLIQNALGKLGAAGEKIVPILITIDPERDTPKHMGEYVARFGKNIVGLSGTPAQIKEAADHFKVYYTKEPMGDDPADYMMNHSGFLYLIGPDGKYITHFPSDIAENLLEKGLRSHVR